MEYPSVKELFKNCKLARKEAASINKEMERAKNNGHDRLLVILEDKLQKQEELQITTEILLPMIPPEDAVLMRMYFIEHQPARRIAYDIGISEKTFFRRKKRILGELQEKYIAMGNSKNL